MASLRLRLFDDVTDSPFSGFMEETEIEAVLTPYGKAGVYTDSSIGSGSDFSIEIPTRKRMPKTVTADTRRSLFSGKRLADDDDDVDTPMTKKLKAENADMATTSDMKALTSSIIIDAVDRLATEKDLVADGSRDYTLPTIPGKHSDLKSISSETMADVLAGKYDEQTEKVTIVDCRYPYEFEGGHIKGAVNMYTKDAVQSLLQEPVTSEKKHVLIFHCEFSSERGPKMCRFLRSQDRELNKENYPALNFPEVYVLDGGYKAFYTQSKLDYSKSMESNYSHPGIGVGVDVALVKDLCDPISYKPMLHEEHAADLRHFRVKSKSWTAGEKQKTSRRCRSRLSCHGLDF